MTTPKRDAFDDWCRENDELVTDEDGVLPVCQHCGETVTWSQRPTDADYKAFVHASGATACR